MVVADSLFEQASTCFETLDFPLRAGREMRIAEKVLVFDIGIQTDVPIIYPQLLKGLKWYTQGSPEKGSRMVFFHIRPQPPDDLRPLNIDFYHISRNHNRPQK